MYLVVSEGELSMIEYTESEQWCSWNWRTNFEDAAAAAALLPDAGARDSLNTGCVLMKRGSAIGWLQKLCSLTSNC